MTNASFRLKPARICLFILIFLSFWSKILFAAIISIAPIPSSGVAPLEVKLICTASTSSSQPTRYTINFGDGSPTETVDSTLYSHTFTHTYEAGYFKPICSVVKIIGITSESKPSKLIVAKWKFETQDDIDSSAAIGIDGTVYIGSDDRNLYAIDPDTGQEIWRFMTDDEVRSSPAVGPDGTIYFGSTDGNLYAVTPNGKKKWAFNIGNFIFSSPAISSDGRIIYIGASDNFLYAVNAASGTYKWKYETGDKIISSPALGHDGIEPVVYVGSLDNHVYALAANNGTLKWKFETNAEVYGSPAISADGRIYVGECKTGSAEEYQFKLFCLNVDGSKNWDLVAGTGFYSSPAIGPEGNIYIGSWDGYLFSIDDIGTTVNWSVRTSPPADINSSPAIGIVNLKDPVIYVGAKDGNFYALQSPDFEDPDRNDWVFQTGDDILYSSPTIDSNGTIYFGSRDNCLYAINPGNMNLADSDWPMFHQHTGHNGFAENIVISDVISNNPESNGRDIDINTNEFRINFSPLIEASQIQPDSFTFQKINDTGANETIEGNAILDWVRYNQAGYNISAVFTRLDNKQALEFESKYRASIKYLPKEQIEGDGSVSEKTYSFTFTTAAETEKDPNPSPEPDFTDFSCFIDSIQHTL